MADAATTPVDALIPAMTLLAAGGAAALASKALKLSPIVGYLAVGILIGPHGLGLVEREGTIALLGSAGLLFLMASAQMVRVLPQQAMLLIIGAGLMVLRRG